MHGWYRAFWVTSTLDDPMPGVPVPEPEFVNFEKLRSPGIDSKVSIPPAWQVGRTKKVVVKAHQDTWPGGIDSWAP